MPTDWERVEGDPALLDRVRHAYTGGGDAADQLWWLDHPGEPGPSGAPDPSIELERARADLYRPDPPRDAHARAAALERGIDADRAAARAAVSALDARRATDPSAPAEAPERTATGGQDPTRPPVRAAAPTRAVLANARRLPVRGLVAALVLALLVGGVLGAVIGRASSTPSAAALSVFATPQDEDDSPASATLPAFVEPASIRLLGTSTTTGLRAYAARTRTGDVCLLGVVLETRFLASCTTREGFAAGGLRLVLRARVDPADDSGVSPAQQIEPHWSPDGAFGF